MSAWGGGMRNGGEGGGCRNKRRQRRKSKGEIHSCALYNTLSVASCCFTSANKQKKKKKMVLFPVPRRLPPLAEQMAMCGE